MQVKAFEIRDRMTFIACIAIKMMPDGETAESRMPQRYLLRRCGYACDERNDVIFTRMDGGSTKAPSDPYEWKDRTMHVAHLHVVEKWDDLKDGDVIDVEFILKETKEKKLSERITVPL